eukprot:CAMPEP_0197003744 /NCGR_PEP_ID=MMETSP1380-20130617/12005_1 /TAXON_ID=5936 /ORGANISM="Euplotes crassus, Strain CT5" /LENGTH=56 /DNA_ID=CAMNT_0042422331 /DNA_START=24 /DNA_END=194 /DNA_ORIENTATION=+
MTTFVGMNSTQQAWGHLTTPCEQLTDFTTRDYLNDMHIEESAGNSKIVKAIPRNVF